ncbi:hypothetical protein AKJ16_DCAP14044 [Drosera capensis]
MAKQLTTETFSTSEQSFSDELASMEKKFRKLFKKKNFKKIAVARSKKDEKEAQEMNPRESTVSDVAFCHFECLLLGLHLQVVLFIPRLQVRLLQVSQTVCRTMSVTIFGEGLTPVVVVVVVHTSIAIVSWSSAIIEISIPLLVKETIVVVVGSAAVVLIVREVATEVLESSLFDQTSDSTINNHLCCTLVYMLYCETSSAPVPAATSFQRFLSATFFSNFNATLASWSTTSSGALGVVICTACLLVYTSVNLGGLSADLTTTFDQTPAAISTTLQSTATSSLHQDEVDGSNVGTVQDHY